MIQIYNDLQRFQRTLSVEFYRDLNTIFAAAQMTGLTARGIVRYARSGLLRAMPERQRGRGDSQGMQGVYFLAPRAPMSARTQRRPPGLQQLALCEARR